MRSGGRHSTNWTMCGSVFMTVRSRTSARAGWAAVWPAVLLALSALLALVQVAATEPPPLIHCAQDKNLDRCVGISFLRIIRAMLTGNHALQVAKLDPLVVPHMPVSKRTKKGKVLDLDLDFHNMIISDICRGLSIKSIRFDLDKLRLDMKLHRPAVHFHGRYRTDGKVLWLPIWGQGNFTMKMSDVFEDFHLVGEREERGDHTYWRVKEYSSTLRPNHMHINYENLFGGRWLLGVSANRLMNEEWKLIYGEIAPQTDAQFSKIMRPFWTAVFARTPLHEMFPADR